MKYIFSISIFLLVTICSVNKANAQSSTEITAAPGRYLLAPNDDLDLEGFQRASTIWSEDFADGIPADWENEASPSPATWEYRGAGTSPSNQYGTIGSCLADGVIGGDPIASPSADNGFVIFDSNYWDDSEGPCGSFGTGTAPGPHLASLTTSSFDLSAYPNVGIEFYQYHKNYQAATKVQASVDGGEWEDVFVNTTPLNNGSTALNDYQRKNISSFVGGQADVRLRFLFDGNYYFWMLDDIAIFELSENNLVLQESSYGDFNPDNPDYITGYEFMEYSQYPVAMSPLLKLSGRVANYGYAPQNNATLNATVLGADGSTVLFDANDETETMEPESEGIFRPGTFQMPSEEGTYPIQFSALQDEEEDEPADNVIDDEIEITEYVYSRDRLETNAVYFPPAIFDNVSYEVGNMFLITAEAQACHSVSVGVSVGSTAGSPLHAAIYKLDVEGGLSTEMVAESDVVPLDPSAYNTIGTNHVQVIPFDAPVQLDKDSVYLVMVRAEEGPSNVLFPLSGTSPNLTSFVRFSPNTWFYLVRTPLIRMNFGEVTSIEEELAQIPELKLYPNPAAETVNVELPKSTERSELWVYNQLGQVLRHLILLPGESQVKTLQTGDLESGAYQVLWKSQNQELRSTLMVR